MGLNLPFPARPWGHISEYQPCRGREAFQLGSVGHAHVFFFFLMCSCRCSLLSLLGFPLPWFPVQFCSSLLQKLAGRPGCLKWPTLLEGASPIQGQLWLQCQRARSQLLVCPPGDLPSLLFWIVCVGLGLDLLSETGGLSCTLAPHCVAILWSQACLIQWHVL